MADDSNLSAVMAAAAQADQPQVRRDDRAWQQQAERRTWMRHWPGLLSV